MTQLKPIFPALIEKLLPLPYHLQDLTLTLLNSSGISQTALQFPDCYNGDQDLLHNLQRQIAFLTKVPSIRNDAEISSTVVFRMLQEPDAAVASRACGTGLAGC